MNCLPKIFSFLFNHKKYVMLLIFILFFFSHEYIIHPVNEAYPKVKELPSGEYFIIMSEGIYISSNDFLNFECLYKFNSNETIKNNEDDNKTVISEFKNDTDYYILSLVKDYLYLYNFKKRKLSHYDLSTQINGKFYNLIPYKIIDNSLYYVIIFSETLKRTISYTFISVTSLTLTLNFISYKINLSEEENNNIFILKSILEKEPSSSSSFFIFSCQIITKQYLICFYLEEDTNTIKISKFDIDNNFTIDVDFDNYYSYDNKIIGIQSSSISESNKIVVSFDYYQNCQKLLFNCYNITNYGIYDIKNKTFINKFFFSTKDMNNNRIYYFKETKNFIVVNNNYKNNFNIYIIGDKENITISDINYYEENILECNIINSFTLIYNVSTKVYNLISDCIIGTINITHWNIIYNISLLSSFSIGQPTDSLLPSFSIGQSTDSLLPSFSIGQPTDLLLEKYEYEEECEEENNNEKSNILDNEEDTYTYEKESPEESENYVKDIDKENSENSEEERFENYEEEISENSEEEERFKNNEEENIISHLEDCKYYYYFTLDRQLKCTDTPRCPNNYNKLIKEKNQCIDDCKKDDTYKYTYEDKCLLGCPINAPYEIPTNKTCNENCIVEDLFSNKCKMNNKDEQIEEELVNKIINSISEGLLNEYININVLGKNEILVYKEDDITYQIISSSNQNNSIKNISSINLGECENKLKEFYKINDTTPLIIFKIDYNIQELFVPIVEYKVFHPITKEPIELDICENTNIILSYPINKEIEKESFKHDLNSEYYNDKCFSYTTEKNTDITLNDRKEIYKKNNLSLCENNCKLEEIDTNLKQSKCECEVKKEVRKFYDIKIGKDQLLQNAMNIQSSTNIGIILCYKTLFCLNGIKKNIGNYIILLIILIHLINCIVFYLKGYKIFFMKIHNILSKELSFKRKNAYITNINETSPKNENRSNKKINKKVKKGKTLSKNNNKKLNNININYIIKSRKKKKKKKVLVNSINFSETKNTSNSLSKIGNIINLDQQSENPISNNVISNNEINIYTDNEINILTYEKAIKIDIRSYCQYYLTLLKTKQMLIFTFYTKNDYNSLNIKISLFLFLYALYYTINSLFFQDSTIHNIYENNGDFDFNYQIPRILYATIISSVISFIIKYFSLSENNIIQTKNKIDNLKEINDTEKVLKIKFIIFFILSDIFLIIFWYYLSCFCAVYKNTQIILLKDTLISFGLYMIYPMGINLIPGLFRIPALRDKKNNKKILYNISKIIQMI